MGRRIAAALLGVGVLSLSCSRATFPIRQAADSPHAQSVVADATDPNDLQQLGGLEARFATLAQSLSPSVVAISASSQPFDSDDLLRNEEMNPEKLDSLLDRTTRMVGTGLIIDQDGYILTNEHVVDEAENVWVTMDDGKVYPALVIGTDPRADLAVLKIPASNLQAVTFATDAPRRGQWAIAVGNPYGLATAGNQSFSIGVVSALDRSLPKLSKKENRLYSGLIQTTTPINPGNSGGPLFDIQGRVIGINAAVILPEKKTNGIGFAIPITPHLLAEVESLKAGHEVTYGYLGVTVSTPTPRDRKSAGIEGEQGVRVEAVDDDSPAKTALKQGDIILAINGEAVRDSDQFVRLIGTAPAAVRSQLAVLRGHDVLTLNITLARRKMTNSAVTRESRRIRWEGMLLGPMPANWKPKTGQRPEHGLAVLAISEKSKFAGQGVTEGDVLTTIAGTRLLDVTQLQQLLNDLPPEKRSVEFLGSKSVVASVRD